MIVIVVPFASSSSNSYASGQMRSDLLGFNESAIKVDTSTRDDFCGSSKFQITDLAVRDLDGTKISNTTVGSRVLIEAVLKSNCEINNHVLLVRLGVDDKDGVTKFVVGQNVTTGSGKSVKVSTPWRPDRIDDYKIIAFVNGCLLCSGDFGIASSADFSVFPSSGWNTALIVGKFMGSDPPKPDRFFKIQYAAVNGTVYSFSTDNMIMAKMNGTGTLEVKFPRNYPYTNSIDGINAFMIEDVGNPTKKIEVNRSTTVCFFEFSVPFEDKNEIEIAWAYVLWNKPYHGDNVPDSCIKQTVVETSPEQLDECAKLGISQDKCSDITILQKAQQQSEERKNQEYEQNQLNLAYYLIGIGGVIAAIMAFVILQRK